MSTERRKSLKRKRCNSPVKVKISSKKTSIPIINNTHVSDYVNGIAKPMIDIFFGEDILNDRMISYRGILSTLLPMSITINLSPLFYGEFINISSYMKNITILTDEAPTIASILSESSESMNITLTGTISAFKDFVNNVPLSLIDESYILKRIIRSLEYLPKYIIRDLIDSGLLRDLCIPEYKITTANSHNFIPYGENTILFSDSFVEGGACFYREYFKTKYLAIGFNSSYNDNGYLNRLRVYGINIVYLDEPHRKPGICIIAQGSYDQWLSAIYQNITPSLYFGKFQTIARCISNNTNTSVENLLYLYKNPYSRYEEWCNKDEDIEEFSKY